MKVVYLWKKKNLFGSISQHSDNNQGNGAIFTFSGLV